MKQDNDNWLTDVEIDEALIAQMDEAEAYTYKKYGHRAAEAAFVGRTFVVYQAERQAGEARVIALYDVTSLRIEVDGVQVGLQNRKTGEALVIGHVPVRLGRYGVFVSVPQASTMKLNAVRGEDEELTWLLSAGVTFKTKNAPHFHNAGNTYIATMQNLERRFGKIL